MARQNPKPVAVLENLDEHPATRAWLRVHPGSAIPHRIDQFRRRGRVKRPGKSSVFRLHGVGRGERTIIAKRGRRDTVALELMIYEEILTRLPISSLRVLGSSTDCDDDPWFFVEDGGEDPFSSDVPEHRHSATRWLAGLHAGAAMSPASAQLPSTGPSFYRDFLRESLALVGETRANPSLTPAHHGILDQVERLGEDLERSWAELDLFCDEMPITLVHGDFTDKNVRVGRASEGALALFVFDWELAGLGCPAVDLATIDLAAHDDGPREYLNIARERWDSLTEKDVRSMVRVGHIFRNVASIRWACEWLPFDDVALPLESLSRYVECLSAIAIQPT